MVSPRDKALVNAYRANILCPNWSGPLTTVCMTMPLAKSLLLDKFMAGLFLADGFSSSLQ